MCVKSRSANDIHDGSVLVSEKRVNQSIRTREEKKATKAPRVSKAEVAAAREGKSGSNWSQLHGGKLRGIGSNASPETGEKKKGGRGLALETG